MLENEDKVDVTLRPELEASDDVTSAAKFEEAKEEEKLLINTEALVTWLRKRGSSICRKRKGKVEAFQVLGTKLCIKFALHECSPSPIGYILFGEYIVNSEIRRI